MSITGRDFIATDFTGDGITGAVITGEGGRRAAPRRSSLAWDPSIQPAPSAAAGSTLPALDGQPVARGHLVKRALAEVVLIVAVVLSVAFLVRTFVAQMFSIPSESRVPQLHVNDRVVVSKLSYRFHDPRRGDIVVFDTPVSERKSVPARHDGLVMKIIRPVGERIGLVQPSTDDFIKRVIGLPNDVVSGHAGHVYVGGRLLVEPYLPAGTITSDFGPITIARGQLWVMGDNRGASEDSRVFGSIPISTVVGRTIVKSWPPFDMSFL